MELKSIYAAIEKLSLRSKLGIVFGALMVLAIFFCTILLYQQHRLAVRGAEIVIRAHEQMATAVEMRDILYQINIQAEKQNIDGFKINRFRKILDMLWKSATGPEKIRINEIRIRFEEFVRVLDSDGFEQFLLKSAFSDLSAAVASFIEMNRLSAFRVAEQLRDQQAKSVIYAVSFLIAFILLITAAGYKIISIFTAPLFSLVEFIDGVNVEDELPVSAPFDQSQLKIPEISFVADSFGRLLQRLKGYRALNVRRLLVEKRRADVIAASISDGVLLLHNDEIIYLNPVGERILGLKPGTKVKGMHLAAFVRQAGSEHTEGSPGETGANAILQAISRTMPVELSIELEERKYHYLIQTYPISYDVVEQIENSVSDQMEVLVDRFQANTLVVAQDVTLVKESHEAKSHFLGTLSHEIKTPVTSLTMATRLLKRTIDQVASKTHKSLILTCAEDVDRLRILLDDLLTVSKFDTLTQQLDYKATDISKLLRHSVQSFQFEASQKGIELVKKISPAAQTFQIPVDPTKIAWTLSNLITNALRHTSKGGRVEIEMDFPEPENQKWIQIKIRDTGPGIERSRQERIFDKFKPYYDLRVARSGSTGSGLAIAREIIVAHGGRIWVSSEPGHGAEFGFCLPVKKRGAGEVENKEIANDLNIKGVISGASFSG